VPADQEQGCTMSVAIPYESWQPLTLAAVKQLFANAPYTWGIAGGYAIEQFLGMSIRDHSDMDIVIYRDQQSRLHSHLADWRLYAADPPGTLRSWAADEYLPYGIHDIWGHRLHARAWELQIMLAETDGDHWFMRKNPQIRGRRDDLIVWYGVPCIRVEVQLLYKARSIRPKDRCDFEACLPHLSGAAKKWLRDNLLLLYPAGHPWLNDLP
jgi:hypothetical protein